jgi:predicted GIY-YIG superfamily endonuclease
LYYNSTNYYVGSSDDIDKRVAEHRNRPQTIANGGIREVLPPLTPAR